MTYCVGLLLKEGTVLLSDTRTNAGIDNISTYKKTFIFEEPGERVIAILTAGSLSVTQTTLARLQADVEAGDGRRSVLSVDTMLEAVDLIGETLSEVTTKIGQKLGATSSASASMIVAGQRRGGDMRLFLLYPQGNFIEATPDTPYLQIGEHKYGKPILDRVVTPETNLTDAKKAVLLSMDSTLRSNLSVGMPLDLTVIQRDSCRVDQSTRIEAGDETFTAMSEAWSQALRNGFTAIDL